MSKKLEYGKWYPISVYYENKDDLDLDWALVQFKETKKGFMPLPYIAEYIKRYGVWTTQSDKDRYLCELCEPIAFMLWQPYEEIKENTNPSEALKCLDYLGNEEMSITESEPFHYQKLNFIYEEYFEPIKQALIKAQEQEKKLKALEIIKKKNVDVFNLKKCIELDLPLTDKQRLHKYNHDYMMIGMEQLTQEEYDLLKEVFADERLQIL